jgi:hypothetical protein
LFSVADLDLGSNPFCKLRIQKYITKIINTIYQYQLPGINIYCNSSAAEPEPVELQHFVGIGAEFIGFAPAPGKSILKFLEFHYLCDK